MQDHSLGGLHGAGPRGKDPQFCDLPLVVEFWRIKVVVRYFDGWVEGGWNLTCVVAFLLVVEELH